MWHQFTKSMIFGLNRISRCWLRDWGPWDQCLEMGDMNEIHSLCLLLDPEFPNYLVLLYSRIPLPISNLSYYKWYCQYFHFSGILLNNFISPCWCVEARTAEYMYQFLRCFWEYCKTVHFICIYICTTGLIGYKFSWFIEFLCLFRYSNACNTFFHK